MKTEQNISNDTFHKIPLFSELSSAQLNKITSISKVQKRSKDEIIFLEDNNYRGFFVLIKGSIKIFKISTDGKETILHIIKPPDTFGDVPLFEGGPYPINAQSITDSLLIFIPKNEFIELLKSNSTMCINMLAGFAKRMRALTRKVEELTTKDVVNRLAEYLLQEIKKAKTEKLPEPFIKLGVTKKNIAAYLGTITETLSRSLKKLQEENIIRPSGKSIFIKDFTRLKELAR
ncbi:MAG: Crp/Fnr family transcriptional regulator [Melioribacter sp.]|nr:Crp/Fnr family transcriptional regulator [Melioribacter sp.]